MEILHKSKLFKFILDEIIKKWVLSLLPDKQYGSLEYYMLMKKRLNLKHPTTLNEKIQWLKIYGGLEKYTKYVDKLEVRNFVSKTIGKDYLVPLLGVWETFEDIPFDKLPRQFVLKATHGSGYVFVCRDKSSVDMKALNKLVTKWMKDNFYRQTREIQYKKCKPMIICEKYIEDENGKSIDYKFFYSNNKPKIIELIWDRFTNHKNDVFLNLNWKMVGYSYISYPIMLPKKPENYIKMLTVAKKLSSNFPFVRVDLYSIKGKIYFGELTFTPANGLEIFHPSRADYQLGKLIDLSKYRNNSTYLNEKSIIRK